MASTSLMARAIQRPSRERAWSRGSTSARPFRVHTQKSSAAGSTSAVNRGAAVGPRGGVAAGATVEGPRGNTVGRGVAGGPYGGVVAGRGVETARGGVAGQAVAAGPRGRVAAASGVRGPAGYGAARGYAAGPYGAAAGFARVTPAGRYAHDPHGSGACTLILLRNEREVDLWRNVESCARERFSELLSIDAAHTIGRGRQ